eukprot:362892-Rhodomonas_salina.2
MELLEATQDPGQDPLHLSPRHAGLGHDAGAQRHALDQLHHRDRHVRCHATVDVPHHVLDLDLNLPSLLRARALAHLRCHLHALAVKRLPQAALVAFPQLAQQL